MCRTVIAGTVGLGSGQGGTSLGTGRTSLRSPRRSGGRRWGLRSATPAWPARTSGALRCRCSAGATRPPAPAVHGVSGSAAAGQPRRSSIACAMDPGSRRCGSRGAGPCRRRRRWGRRRPVSPGSQRSPRTSSPVRGRDRPPDRASRGVIRHRRRPRCAHGARCGTGPPPPPLGPGSPRPPAQYRQRLDPRRPADLIHPLAHRRQPRHHDGARLRRRASPVPVPRGDRQTVDADADRALRGAPQSVPIRSPRVSRSGRAASDRPLERARQLRRRSRAGRDPRTWRGQSPRSARIGALTRLYPGQQQLGDAPGRHRAGRVPRYSCTDRADGQVSGRRRSPIRQRGDRVPDRRRRALDANDQHRRSMGRAQHEIRQRRRKVAARGHRRRARTEPLRDRHEVQTRLADRKAVPRPSGRPVMPSIPARRIS